MKNLLWIGKCLIAIAFFAIVPYNCSLLVEEADGQIRNVPAIISIILGTIFIFVCVIGLLIREYKNEDCDIFD